MYNFDSFQLIVRCTEEAALEIASILNRTRPGAPNGSSFAITSDAPSGLRYVHLSRASYNTLQEAGFFEPDTKRYENVTSARE